MGRIVYSKYAILAPVREMRNAVFVVLLIVLAAVAVIGYVFSTYISRPVERLISGVEKIEAGDLKHEVDVEGGDELGRLGSSFNRMAKILDMKISELQSMNADLSRLDTLKDEFLANTSHELRTPLNGIMGIAESLLEGAAGELGATRAEQPVMIATSGRRLAHLVNDILDFSRLRNMDIQLTRKPVDLFSVAQLIVSITAPLAKEKGLDLRNTIIPGTHIIDGDENRLQQILLNIVDNAIKFTEGEASTCRPPARRGCSRRYLPSPIRESASPRTSASRSSSPSSRPTAPIARRYGGTGLGPGDHQEARGAPRRDGHR